MILVTGATGTVGTPLVTELLAKGAQPRAMVRGKGTAVDGADEVVADLADPASLAPAVDGVSVIYLLVPVVPNMAQLARNVIDAAAKAGQPRVVLHAAIGVERRYTDSRFIAAHVEVFDHLVDSGLPWTLLAPNGFLQNLSNQRQSLRAGVLASSIGDARVSLIDARDVAAAAAAVLTGDGHAGKTYTLTGPQSLHDKEIAAELSTALGHKIDYMAVTPEASRAAMLDAGMPQWTVDGIIELNEMYAKRLAEQVSPDVPTLIGRPPRSLADFVRDNVDALR
ncbi:MAG: NAD(P)H-binding protein [Sciscionella sp.]|nr:NAD(P)H-binding protein [Sciscionella sp.]